MIEDAYGHRWESERLNGYGDGPALSLLMFWANYPTDDLRVQQNREEPIGGWQDAHGRLILEMSATCPEGFKVAYAPFEFQQRHVLTYLPIA